MAVYIAKADIDNVFGTVNVAKWSNLDNLDDAQSPDTDRITAAIEYAEEYFHMRLGGSVYETPLDDSPVLKVVKDIVAKLAGVWLYESRGVDDFDAESDNPVVKHRDWAENMINRILRGEVSLTSTHDGFHTTAPDVI